MERIISTTVLLVANVLLALVLRLDRRRLGCALRAAATVAILDVSVEILLGRFGVWRYRLPMCVLGVPVELVLDVFLVLLAVCIGFAAFARRRGGGRAHAAYVSLASFALGTWAVLKNTRAARTGMVAFERRIDVGTPWFVVGNIVAVVVLVTSVTVLYRAFAREWPSSHR